MAGGLHGEAGPRVLHCPSARSLHPLPQPGLQSPGTNCSIFLHNRKKEEKTPTYVVPT